MISGKIWYRYARLSTEGTIQGSPTLDKENLYTISKMNLRLCFIFIGRTVGIRNSNVNI